MPAASASPADSRTRLLDAALDVVRTRGYAATRVDDICDAAGLSKGSFFHHFTSKEELAVAAAEHWSRVTGAFFAAAPYHALHDPLDRVLGYLAFRRAILRGELPEFTCYAGTTVQETYATHPAIGEACGHSITSHAAVVAKDIAEAKRMYAPRATWTAESLALHTQAVLQGAFVVAKATGGARAAVDSVDHLIRYVELLFGRSTSQSEKP
jgi:TetR/AcrR family transcriptional repressor of nem operon